MADQKDQLDNVNHHGSKIAIPEIVGPGTWFCLHLEGYHAKTPAQIQNFIGFITRVTSNFKCLNCRKHAMKYIANHPFEPYVNMTLPNGEQIGMFRYTFDFHNTVNKNIGKPVMDFDEAYKMFSDQDGAVCTKACGQHGTEQADNKVVIPANAKANDNKSTGVNVSTSAFPPALAQILSRGSSAQLPGSVPYLSQGANFNDMFNSLRRISRNK
jgi:hypothetical protein